MKRHKQDINPENGRFEVPLTYDGRNLTLIKREQSKDAPWYLRIEHRRKPYWRSTDTTDAELALNKAKTLIKAILEDDSHTLQSTRLREPVRYAKLGEVCALFEKLTSVGDPKKTLSALRCLVRGAFGAEAVMEQVSTERLTAKAVRDFQANAVKRVREQKFNAAQQRAGLVRAQRTANSVWNQAHAMFKAELMAQYADAGLHFPDAFKTEFLTAPKIKGLPRVQYVQPLDGLLEVTLRGQERLMAAAQRLGFVGAGEFKDRRVVAFILEMGCGLRAGELTAAQGSWLGRANGALAVSLPLEYTKNGMQRQLLVPGEYEGYLLAYVQRRNIKADDRLVPNGGKVVRVVSRWMRRLGWTGTKTNHALRKYFGYVIAKEYGMEVAQWMLGHADIATTQKLYAGIIKNEKAVMRVPKFAPSLSPAKPDPKVIAMPKVA